MSRSRRHAPFIGHTTAASDKPWKQQHARKLRRAVHQALDQTCDGDALLVSRYALGHAGWDAPKDGRQRLRDLNSRYLRK
jgi:hypothetical protein